MKFKHSLIIRGENKNLQVFIKDLDGLGYINDFKGRACTLSNVQSLAIQGPSINDGQYRIAQDSGSWTKRDFEFNIDNSLDYRKALSIAAIREDNFKCYPGEVLKVVSNGYGMSPEDIDKYVKVVTKPENKEDIGGFTYDTPIYWTPLSPDMEIITKWGRKGKSVQASNISMFRKATSEEIIEFFNEQKSTKMDTKMNTKREFQIGDSVKILNNDHGGKFAIDSIGVIISTGNNPNFEVTIAGEQWYYAGDGDLELVTTTSGKKVIGYKLIREYPGSHPVGAIINGVSTLYEKYPEYFEPVYEQIIKKETIVIGSTNLQVTIGSDKSITNTRAGNPITIEEVKETYLHYKDTISNSFIGGYNVSIDREARFIRIGCNREDHRVSLRDLLEVIKIYENLNP